ncbi:HEPN domain-containing protein [Gemmata sp.]|uniref:HEPN domain-containing protein n=1 Tax=Gemmata sp. TaxID=1914242 RepID=UPI003F7136E3
MAKAKPKSRALTDFESSIASAEELLIIERTVPNPPRKADQTKVSGLRGGAAVLMVASFEAFLKATVIEHLTELTVHPPPVPFASLPSNMRVNSVYLLLETAMKGHPHQPKKDRADRLLDIKAACTIVTAEKIDPQVLCSTKSNPSASTVTELFNGLGVKDVLNAVHARFMTKWGKPEAATFIRDKLDEIVQRRHRVAHTGQALDITRQQLNESVKFLTVLAAVLDRHLRAHVDSLYPP